MHMNLQIPRSKGRGNVGSIAHLSNEFGKALDKRLFASHYPRLRLHEEVPKNGQVKKALEGTVHVTCVAHIYQTTFQRDWLNLFH